MKKHLLISPLFAMATLVMSQAATAAPGHNGEGHHHDAGHHHNSHSHGHGAGETAYGKPGDPAKPSREVAIKMVETDEGMAFIPSNITVAKGEQIEFSVANAGELDHEIVIATEAENNKHAEMMKKDPHMAHDDPNALRLAPGKNGSIIWHFTKAGTFDMSCLIPGHKEAGMTGSVTVK